MQNQNLYNSSRVLQAVWQQESISRTEIANQLGLNKSTITKLLSPMIDDGIILAIDKQASGHQGGRKAEVLTVNEKFGSVIGIEVNTSFSVFCVTDLKGNIILHEKFKHNKDKLSFQELIDFVLEYSISKCKKRGISVLGVTLGVSGIINPYEGIIYRSNPLNIDSPVRIYEKLKTYPFPILIENDANCCCSSQLVKSASERKRNFITVLGEFRKPNVDSKEHGGIAIGIGLVIKDSILHGENFSAGEFQSINKDAPNTSQFNLTEKEVSRVKEDEKVLSKVLRELSRNLSLLVNTLNISHIYFEGDIVEAEFMLKPILRDEIQRNWNYNSQVDCQISFSENGDDAVAHGAACYFLEKLFSPPRFWEDKNDYYQSGIEFFNKLKELKRN
ncbi:MAG: ROK family transcriptional regulator [Spirochaetaceae bacterium]